MIKRRITQILIVSLLLAIFSNTVVADTKRKSRRWRLQFDFVQLKGAPGHPVPVEVREPDGTTQTYWYFLYKIINDTDRDIPYAINIKMVIDKTKEGIPESQVPGLFYKAQIPATFKDKELYIKSLRTYSDIDLPLVKKEILSRLGIHPELTTQEKRVLGALNETAKSVMEVATEVGLTYAETDRALNVLTVRNLALSQEISGNPIFVGAQIGSATFNINGENVVKQKGDDIAGWQIVSFDSKTNTVTLQKDGASNLLSKGSTIEFLYSKSYKTPVERDNLFSSGIFAKGTYLGKTGDRYNFQRRVIPKKSVSYGMAIFQGVSPEVDFMSVIISGLVNPIVRRYKVVYAYNEVLMLGYEILGDEYSIHTQPLVPLYKKWEVLSTKVFRKYE